MAGVNQICEDLIRNVTNCELDYKMHQTPLSLFFSIRKKFSKHSTGGGASSFQSHQAHHVGLTENFREELFRVRNEYEKLFNFYQAGLVAYEQLKDQMHALNEELSSKNVLQKNQETEIKKLNHEAKSFGVKFEEKCKEVKQLKIEVNVLNQDKNALSVANKSAKQESKQQSKTFDKKVEAYERKITELNEFKIRKLNEEREEKIKKRKELKKETKRVSKQNKDELKDTKNAENETPKPTVVNIDVKKFNLLKAEDPVESDTMAEKNEDTIVDVETKNRFESLVDINDNNENLAHHHPEPRLECVSLNQNFSTPRLPASSCPSGDRSITSTSSAVTRVAVTPSKRIQCDQCARKCVDKRDMEHHIFLWHSETHFLMSRPSWAKL